MSAISKEITVSPNIKSNVASPSISANAGDDHNLCPIEMAPFHSSFIPAMVPTSPS